MAILLWLPWVIQSEYLIWLLGLIVYRFVGRVSRTKALASCWVGGLFVCASVIYGKLNSLQLALGVPSELLTALSFCVLAVGLTNIKNNDQLPSWIQIIVRKSSDISFSLYVIHFPLVVLIAGYFYGFEKLRPDAAGLTQYTLWLGFILIFSACFWWMFERRTNRIRRGVTLAMESRFGWRLNS